MTDRVSGFIVTLGADLRADDDAEEVRKAIRMIRGVIDVEPIEGGSSTEIATTRAVHECVDAILKMLDERRKG